MVISRASLTFKKRFEMLFEVREGGNLPPHHALATTKQTCNNFKITKNRIPLFL